MMNARLRRRLRHDALSDRPVLELVVALACLLPTAAHAACDVARFGESATKTCPRSTGNCIPSYLPEEISDIAKGAVVESVGLAVNDGRASWRALDIDRKEVVVVERYAGRRRGQAPRVNSSTPYEYLKTFDQDQTRWVDHVRRYPLSAAKFMALTCLASGAWSEGPAPSHELTDISSRFYLLLAESAQTASALGRFGGTPGNFARIVDDIVQRQRPGVQPR
jgi:hypothetical protein